MNERIKKLRKVLDLTQQEFADRIGMKRNTVANYETNRNSPSNSVISLICRTFNVSEEWLREGTGEIFSPSPSAALDALARERTMTYSDYVLIEKFLNPKPQVRLQITELMLEVAAALNNSDSLPDTLVFSKPKDINSEIETYSTDVRLCHDVGQLEDIQRNLLLETVKRESVTEDKSVEDK